MHALSNNLWAQDRLENSRSKTSHEWHSHQMQALWKWISRSIQLQDARKDSRRRKMLSLWSLSICIDLGSSSRVSYAHSLWWKAVPVPILWSNFPSEAIAKETRKYLSQPRLRCSHASWEKPQLSDLRKSVSSQGKFDETHGFPRHRQKWFYSR